MAALRFTAYSQLEYITAAMLARHVKPGGARVLQVPALSVLCCAVLCCAVLCCAVLAGFQALKVTAAAGSLAGPLAAGGRQPAKPTRQ